MILKYLALTFNPIRSVQKSLRFLPLKVTSKTAMTFAPTQYLLLSRQSCVTYYLKNASIFQQQSKTLLMQHKTWGLISRLLFSAGTNPFVFVTHQTGRVTHYSSITQSSSQETKMLKPFSMAQAVNKSGTNSKSSNLTEEQ